MGLLKKFAEGLKGDKAYQEGKARRKAERAKRKASKKAAKAKKRLSKAGVEVSKETAAKSGKIRRGVKGAEVTKGGAYAKYGKKTGAAKSFRSAFKAAEGKDFTWDGSRYSGKKAAPKKAAPKIDRFKEARDRIDEAGKQKDAASRKASQKVGEEIKREGMQAGGMVAPPTEPSIAPQPAYKEGGKVESNPYGWPTRDARSGLSEKE